MQHFVHHTHFLKSISLLCRTNFFILLYLFSQKYGYIGYFLCIYETFRFKDYVRLMKNLAYKMIKHHDDKDVFIIKEIHLKLEKNILVLVEAAEKVSKHWEWLLMIK